MDARTYGRMVGYAWKRFHAARKEGVFDGEVCFECGGAGAVRPRFLSLRKTLDPGGVKVRLYCTGCWERLGMDWRGFD